jgi:hypothetical protein
MRHISKERIERDYPHRIAMDPVTCPVCCGGGETTDPNYGGKVIHLKGISTDPNYGGKVIHLKGISYVDTIYECRACEVWK